MFARIFARIAKINRLWILFIAAVLLGSLSTFLSSAYLKTREKNIAEELKRELSGGPTIEVLVSSKNLRQGDALGPTLVKREVPKDLIEDGTILPSDYERVAGVKLTRPLRAGYPINTSYFVEKSMTVTDAVDAGMRAITIEVDEINSMAQMVKPGNRVDLMLVVPDRADTEGGVEVILLLQNVKVLATGQSVVTKSDAARSQNPQAPGGREQSYSNFTFEVTPQEAATIALAQNAGKIRAVLRTAQDEATISIKDVNTRTLLRVEQKLAERRQIAAKARVQEMEVQQAIVEGAKKSQSGGLPAIDYIIGGLGGGSGPAVMGRPAAGAEGPGTEGVKPGPVNTPAVSPSPVNSSSSTSSPSPSNSQTSRSALEGRMTAAGKEAVDTLSRATSTPRRNP